MLPLITSRLLQLPLILAAVFAVTFVLVWLIPGNPLQNPEGKRPDPAIEQAMLRQYHLHDPWVFAGQYLKGVVTQLDFGPSLQYRDMRVRDILLPGLRVSATLGAVAIGLALLIGVGVGVIGALKPGSALDGASLIAALIGVSLPSFITGTAMLLLFGAGLRWLPIGGWGEGVFPLRHLILPGLTLSLMPAAYIARLVRLGLADAMSSHYVRTARAKGASEWRIVTRHALKVAFLPVLSFLGPAAAAAMTGSFVVEQVFSVPGLGEHFVNAVLNKDQFLILAVVLTYATLLVTFNLLTDVAYAWVDPRIEISSP